MCIYTHVEDGAKLRTVLQEQLSLILLLAWSLPGRLGWPTSKHPLLWNNSFVHREDLSLGLV